MLDVDGAQVGVLEKPHQVGLTRLLQSHHGRALEARVGLEVLLDLAHQALERQLGGLLVAAYLAQRHRAVPVLVGLLHALRVQRARGPPWWASCLLCRANSNYLDNSFVSKYFRNQANGSLWTLDSNRDWFSHCKGLSKPMKL